MAATLVEEVSIPIGQGFSLCWGTVTFDNSYPTGGEAIDATGDIGYKRFCPAGASDGYVPIWDKTNQKLKLFRQKDPAAAGGADIALPEVANTADMSAVSVDFVAIRPA